MAHIHREDEENSRKKQAELKNPQHETDATRFKIK